MVAVYGAKGYIGSRYCELYHADPLPRNCLEPNQTQVLYLISTTHNHHLANNAWIDIDTNITHLLRVLEQCRHHGGVEFNFISSWFVYGATTEPCLEHDLCDPQGFYSITKRTAEQLLMEYCRHHGIVWRIMRLCNVIGGQDPGSGPLKNVLHAMARDIKHHRPITLINQGRFRRSYLHRDDVCSAIDHVMRHGAINAIYNIGSGQSVFFRDVIDYAMRYTNSSSDTLHRTNDDVIDCVMDCGKLQRLGWQPQMTWQAALEDVIQHA